MKLFGLVEAMHFETMFFESGPIPIPHTKLFEKLETSGRDLSVGLELVSPDKSINYGPALRIENQKIYLDLYDFFKSRGNKIYFLESKDFYRQLGMLTEKAVSIRKQIDRSQNDCEKEFLDLELDKILVEFDYMQKVGKEGLLFDNILNYEPDLIFLGDGHAVRLYKRKENLHSSYGINIEEYWRDEIVKLPSSDEVARAALLSSDEEMPIEYFLKDEIEADLKKIGLTEQVTDHPESIKAEREYRALKTNRITDGNPHFIGTWNLPFEYRGLFEVYVTEAGKDGNISGLIEDTAGSAKFSGRIQDGIMITFVKTYTNPLPWAIKSEINYKGSINLDGEFLGEYEGEGGGGRFKMKQTRSF